MGESYPLLPHPSLVLPLIIQCTHRIMQLDLKPAQHEKNGHVCMGAAWRSGIYLFVTILEILYQSIIIQASLSNIE